MEWLHLIALALIQGVTEFLPISSSAHLILPAQLLGWPDQGLAFDIAVHLGTLGAVIVYFRDDLAHFAASGWTLVARRERDEYSDLLLRLALATLPVVIVGFLLEDFVATQLRSVWVIAATTILFGLLLWFADRHHGAREAVTWRDALVIGLMQVLAIAPGTSRSGITITAALLLGLSRTSAARFSFLLAIPTIAGAALLTGIEIAAAREPARWGMLASAALLSGVAAYLCIRTFIALIERTGMLPYVVYRLLLGALLLLIGFGVWS
ncbi:MAG: undecaprenyl-diphosphate phosphatase [Pseudomonadales bacterium]